MATKSKAIATETKANVAEAKATTEKKDSTKEVVKADAPAEKGAATKKAATTKKATATKKTTTTKTSTEKKAAAKKTTTAKKAVNIEAKTIVQYSGKDVVISDILETVKKVWVDKFQGKLEEVNTLEVYVKPEENKAYFAVNGLGNGDYFVEL